MALFRKKNAEHPITAFWAWWVETAYAAFESALERQDPASMAGPVTKRLAQIHPELVWETSAGTTSRHRLTVSSNGAAELRPLAERWLRAAPPSDAIWEYRAARERDAHGASGQRLDIAGHRLQLDDARFGIEVDQEGGRVHVEVFHPQFGEMPEDARLTVAYLLLDWVVGEDDVERWIGGITPLIDAPASPANADDLVAAVSALDSHNDPDQWGVGRGTDEKGNPLLVTMRRGVRWIDAPTLDLHHLVRLSYLADENGLPLPDELDRLRAAEDRMLASVGESPILIGHISSAGQRTFHFYSDSEDQNITATLKAAATDAGASIEMHRDPAWHDVRQLTG